MAKQFFEVSHPECLSNERLEAIHAWLKSRRKIPSNGPAALWEMRKEIYSAIDELQRWRTYGKHNL